MNSSRINLDEILSQLPQWNLVLTFGGADFPVRELRISDLAKLQPSAMEKTPDLVQFVASLFEGNRPNMDGWSLDVLSIVIGRIASYARERSEKNSRIATQADSQSANAQQAA